MLLQINHKLLGNNAVHRSARFTVAKLLLRLSLKLRFLYLDTDDRRHTLADIFTGKTLGFFNQFI